MWLLPAHNLDRLQAYEDECMSVWVYECMRVNGVSRISQSSDSPTLQPSYLTHTFNNSLLNTICWWQLQSFSFVAYARIIIIRTQQVIRLLDSLNLLTPHTNNYFVLLQCKGAVSYSTVEESLSLSLSLFLDLCLLVCLILLIFSLLITYLSLLQLQGIGFGMPWPSSIRYQAQE